MIASPLIRLQRALPWAIFISVLLCSACLSGYRIAEPLWEGGHHGYHMGEYPHYALNFLRFGYLDTKLGLVMNYGESKPPNGFSYRLDYGSLSSILISFAYRIFGVHEWSARLFPVVLSIGTAAITYLLALKLTGNQWSALMAMAFCALSPMQTYYARLTAPQNFAVFFCILVFLCYWLWFITKHRVYLYGIFIALTLGACAEWIAYFVVVPILVHYLIFCDGRRDWRFIIILTLSPVLLFTLFIFWTYWLTGGSSLEYLWNKFLFRAVSGGNYGSPYVYTGSEVWQIFYQRSKYWLTTPVVVLSLAWFIDFVRAIARRKITSDQGLIFALFLFGFSHNLVFTNLVFIHDFSMLYKLVPVFAIASAIILTRIVARYLRRERVLVIMIVIVICYLFIEQSLGVFRLEHHRWKATFVEAYYLGKALNETVSGSGSYVDAAELGRLGRYRVSVLRNRGS